MIAGVLARLSRPPELAVVARQLALAADLPGHRLHEAHPIEWARWFAIVDEHQLGAFLASRAPPGSFPAEIHQELEGQRIRAGHEAFFKHWALARAFEAFDAMGIRAIALKGAALFSALYRECAEREMSDIDLLFERQGDLAKASSWLESEGYGPLVQEAAIAGHHHVPPLASGVAELTFELHTNLATPPLPDALMQVMIERSVFVADRQRALDPVFRLVHHALHALSDPIDSPLLRNLFEVGWMAHLLSAQERAALVEIADRFSLGPRLSPALHMAAALFGTHPIFSGPSIDARAVWGWRRLGWVRSFDERTTPVRRIERSLAAQHFRSLKRGASARRWGPFAAAAKAVVIASLEGLVQKVPAIGDAYLSPASVAARPIGDRLLVHSLETKRVHLLDPLSRAVFESIGRGTRMDALARSLEADGADRSAVEAAVTEMVALRLLVAS
jgi:hypothetical protein